ncbi:hypothetical protein B5E58_08695 [Tyzzerella sp. An114]|uniref:PP2C family protein-serine/threonine phosphatase n=1 Tax=Tyzzerella sp. An114 TaxID=1965545 RepID=UPI000B44BB98|nr:PP2C family serine/threonine-protein phosphatase [Tyzzerella sp. An114]OUQ57644.1 hypothetical protein B5E58_08695 [Tyzzerella sp. An114]
MVSFYVDCSTDIGNFRKYNEDNYIFKIGSINGKNIGVFCVADGMGGLSCGDVASSIAIETVLLWWDSKIEILSEYSYKIEDEFWENELRNLFRCINDKIINMCHEKNVKKSGSTFSLLLIYNKKYFIIHAGDSRIYIKNKRYFEKLTEDQTLINMLIKNGEITIEQSKNNNKSHILYNCLGVFENPEEYFKKGMLRNKDTFLICSDGLYNMISDEDIKSYMGKPENISQTLVNIAKNRGSRDNITSIYIYVNKTVF